MTKVSLETVREVARVLRDSSLAEIDIAGIGGCEGQRLRLRRAVVFAPKAPPTAPVKTQAAATPAEQSARENEEVAETNEPPYVVVRAMAVGIYHLPPNGLEVGAVVQAGQMVGIIESLNIPSEIPSPIDGRVEEITVEEGQGVGYDLPLLRLLPLTESSES